MEPSPRFGAAAPAGQATRQRRHPAPAIGDQLQRASADLDVVMREVHAGIRFQRQYDDLEERAQTIAASIVGAFRNRPAPRPVHPPIGRTADGRYVW